MVWTTLDESRCHYLDSDVANGVDNDGDDKAEQKVYELVGKIAYELIEEIAMPEMLDMENETDPNVVWVLDLPLNGHNAHVSVDFGGEQEPNLD